MDRDLENLIGLNPIEELKNVTNLRADKNKIVPYAVLELALGSKLTIEV